MTYMSISVATTTIYEKNQGRRGSRNLAGTFFAKKIGKLFWATIGSNAVLRRLKSMCAAPRSSNISIMNECC